MVTHSSLRPNVDADLLVFHGELDILSAGELSERAKEIALLGSGGLVLDLTPCPFVDSSGLLSVLEAWRALDRQERAMAIVVKGNQVSRLLSLSGIDQAVNVCRSREEAVALLRAAPTDRAGDAV